MVVAEAVVVCCANCARQGKRVVFFDRTGDIFRFCPRDHQFTLTKTQLLVVCRPCGSLSVYPLG